MPQMQIITLEVYRFLRNKIGTNFMQFIPIVECINQQGEIGFQEVNQVSEYSVKPEQWGTFLITIFDEWVRHDVGTVLCRCSMQRKPPGMALHPRCASLRRHVAMHGHSSIKVFAKAGCNEPCPCGSDRKFKLCHGK